MNKKAWIRILEAFLAIILITGILIVLYGRAVREPRKSEQIYRSQEIILDEISADSTYREAVLRGEQSDVQLVKSFIESRIPPGFVAEIKICNVEDICELAQYREDREEVYSTERIISATTTQETPFNPKKLKIFMWEE